MTHHHRALRGRRDRFAAITVGEGIYTEADTLEELREMVKDAVACHFDESRRPRLIRLHFVREEILAAWGYRGTGAAAT